MNSYRITKDSPYFVKVNFKKKCRDEFVFSKLISSKIVIENNIYVKKKFQNKFHIKIFVKLT